MAGERTLPGLGLEGFMTPGSDDWHLLMDPNLRVLSAVVQLVAISETTALPGSGSIGDIYIVPGGAGANPGEIAIWDGEAGSEAWVYVVPKIGWIAYVSDTDETMRFEATGWEVFSSGAGGGGGGGGAPLETPFEGFRAKRSGSAQAIPSTTDTVVIYNSEEVDSEGAYDAGTGVFTVPASLDGKHMIFTASVMTQSTETMFVNIKRGDEVIARTSASGGNALNLSSGPVLVSTGDEISVFIFATTGADVIGSNADFTSSFSGVVVAPSAGYVAPPVFNEITASANLVEGHLAGEQYLNLDSASAITLTVPAGLTGVLPVHLIRQGSGAVDVAAGAGVTINSPDGLLDLRVQYSAATLIPLGSDTYQLIGDLA